MSTQTAETVKLDLRHENEAHAKADRDLKGQFLAGNPGGPELPDGLAEKLWPSANGVNEELPSAINALRQAGKRG